jgi:hypothetical protein
MRRIMSSWAVAMAAIAGVTSVSVGSASAATDEAPLSSLILTSTLPGLVLAAPGPQNGPLTQATLALLGPMGSALEPDFSSAHVTGYIRVWSPSPSDGSGVVIVGFRWSSQQDAESFLAGTQHPQGGAAVQPITTSIPGAVAAALQVPTGNQTRSEYSVAFVRGDLAFDVETISNGNISEAQALQVAASQASRVPGPVGTPVQPRDTYSSAYKAGEGFGALLLISAVVAAIWLTARRKRPPRNMTEPPPWSPPPGVAPPLD